VGLDVVSERGDNTSAAPGGGRFLTPAQARQDAADRLVGRRTLLALRLIAIITAIVFAALGMATDPDIGGIESELLRLLMGAAFAALGVAGVVAVIVCRRPARRQVFWLTESIMAAGWLAILAGGIGLIGNLDGPVPTVVFGTAIISGLATLVLLYIWRAR
jgi:hypothetical protein